VLVHVPAVFVMEMPVVEIVDVARVTNLQVCAGVAVFVRMFRVLFVFHDASIYPGEALGNLATPRIC